MDAHEAARYVFGSANRLAVLRSLDADPGRPRGVADRVGVSRATAQRCLRTCADRGWVERADGDYRLTPVGERVVGRCTRLVEALDVIDERSALLADLPRFDPPLPLTGLSDASVVASTREQPHRAARSLTERVRESDAERFRCVAPSMTQLYIDAFAERLADGATVELVCSAAVLDAEREARPENVAHSLALPGFDLHVYPSALDYGLVVTETAAFLGATGGPEGGTLNAGVWTADDDVREWADERYAAAKAASTPADQPS